MRCGVAVDYFLTDELELKARILTDLNGCFHPERFNFAEFYRVADADIAYGIELGAELGLPGSGIPAHEKKVLLRKRKWGMEAMSLGAELAEKAGSGKLSPRQVCAGRVLYFLGLCSVLESDMFFLVSKKTHARAEFSEDNEAGLCRITEALKEAFEVLRASFIRYADYLSPDENARFLKLLAPEDAAPGRAHLPKQRAQEKAILDELYRLGHDRLALPEHPQGQPGIKSAVRKATTARKDLFPSVVTFNKAWERLREAGEIKQQQPVVCSPKLGDR